MWNFEHDSSRIALIDDQGMSITYAEMCAAEEEIYSKINRRCLVFVLCENRIGSIIGYASFINSRVVPVLLNSKMEKSLLLRLLEIYKPSYIWMPSDSELDDLHVSSIFKKWGYILSRTEYDLNYPLNNDLCLLLTTSGSTGSPKFVRQSYENVRSNALSIVEYLKIDANERPITTLPMNYTYGLSIINSHLFVGATILVTDKGVTQRDFWQFFKEEGATSFGGVPYTYEILEKLRFMRMDLPSLKYFTQAGGKLSTTLHAKFAEYAQMSGKQFFVMYGQCEATARMAYLPAEYSVSKCGSMGIAIPGGRFHIIDADGNTVDKANTEGELVYEGKNVTMGYAEKGEDLSLGDERGGVLYTGDIARIDEDGFYYIVGRKKRFLKVFGNRVNLDDIENLIKKEYVGIEVACAGVDDHLYIFTTDSEKLDELRSFAALKTGLNMSAFKTMHVEEIPKNEAGKIQYRELEKYYAV